MAHMYDLHLDYNWRSELNIGHALHELIANAIDASDALPEVCPEPMGFSITNHGATLGLSAFNFGHSTSRGHWLKVGRHGVGLKDAIAIIMRFKGEMTICSGENLFSFCLNQGDFGAVTIHLIVAPLAEPFDGTMVTLTWKKRPDRYHRLLLNILASFPNLWGNREWLGHEWGIDVSFEKSTPKGRSSSKAKEKSSSQAVEIKEDPDADAKEAKKKSKTKKEKKVEAPAVTANYDYPSPGLYANAVAKHHDLPFPPALAWECPKHWFDDNQKLKPMYAKDLLRGTEDFLSNDED
eukprot:TRINITY_DN11096_c0_g1_i1.p2 TRINITY_DN11096_c0_g1~~TRINITY_DN11096_c0_g1_i1.p2  ORF type:complete len:294 (+),score=48.69 TRINITY_DN11096_c0_g1_i1:539-1420(+)